MAQERMHELTEMVKRHYLRFPSETWERTRTVLNHEPPHRLFAHIESLLSARKIDTLLQSNEAFRKLVADMYGARHPWLRDADLGQERWEAYQEFSALTLTEEARRAARKPEAMAKRRREIMIRKIREGKDVDKWRKRLGFEGVVFGEDEIRGGNSGQYGQNEARTSEGVEIGASVDGKDGEYGPEPLLKTTYPKVEHVGVPKAPAEGGQAPRNPFTSEWKGREAPDGWSYPAVFDPCYTSNQFIGRTTKYPLPKLPEPKEDDDADGDQVMTGRENRQAPPAIAALATATKLIRSASSMTGVERPGGNGSSSTTTNTTNPLGSIRLVGENAPTRPPLRQLPGSFTISTRTDGQEGSHSQPSIVVTDSSPTTQHYRPLFEPLSTPLTSIREDTEPPGEGPATESRIFTPARALIPCSPTPTSPESPSSDVEMTDPFNFDEDDTLDPLDTNWLQEFLRRDVNIPADDLEMMSYRGWRIHSPKIQLIRIKNFLADEDIDRTIHWESRFAEIGAFLQHCVRLPDATEKSWYPDLVEAIGMMHCHWVFEQHHYGEKKLILDFPQPSSTSTRLPQVQGGRAVVVEKTPEEELRPRYLLHRIPESIQDVDYQIPGPLLRQTFLSWFRQDGNLAWESDSSQPGSGERGKAFEYEPDFNMALTEEKWFEKCMTGGPETTVREMKGEANFYMLRNECVAGEVDEMMIDGKTHKQQRLYPEGEVLQRFSRYRGTKRAALQQCLSHFDGIENVAIQGPFRKLVLPLTKRQKQLAKAQAGHGIVYKPHAIKQPPEGEKLDPLGLAFWHQRMRESRYERAFEAKELTDSDQADFVRETHDETDPVLTPTNFLGPITQVDFLRESEKKMVMRWRSLNELRDNLTRAYNRAPRQMLEGVLKNIQYGFEGAESWDARDELYEHRQQHGKYLPLDDKELYWIQWLCQASTNPKMERDELPALGREFEVFVERMQNLLDDMNMEGLLAVYEKKAEVANVAFALNSGLREGDYVLSEEMVGKFCKLLANHGRLRYEVENGKIMISRPACSWHPEHRIKWPSGDDPWDPRTNVFDAANLPRPNDKRSWEGAFADVDAVNVESQITKMMLWPRAYRFGVELDGLVRSLRQLDQKLRDPTQWDYRALSLQDVTGSWKNRFDKRIPGFAPPVSYVSVLKAGDPGKWKAGMTEAEAYQAIRKGIIDELSEGNNALWAGRPRFSTIGKDKKEVMTLHRDRVWDWARPEVVGVKKQFFSINRWPVHLQTEKRQEEIRRSVEDEERDREKKRAEEEAALDRMEEEIAPTAEELRKREFDRALSVPYHQGPDSRTRFVPQTEFWGGDTVSQTRALEEHIRRTVAAELDPDSGRAPGSRQSDPSSVVSGPEGSIRLPEVRSPDVPRSIPGFMARREGRFPASLRPTGPPLNVPAPVTIERIRPTFPPAYPPEDRGESQRRVRFVGNDPQEGSADDLQEGTAGDVQTEKDKEPPKGSRDDLWKGFWNDFRGRRT